jgi:hypothetical protein
VADFPHVKAWMDRISARPAAKVRLADPREDVARKNEYTDEQFQTLFEGATRQGSQTQAALLLFRRFSTQNRAVLVEAGEQTGDVIQVGAEYVRGTFFGDVVQDFAELGQASTSSKRLPSLRNTPATRV